MPASQQFSGIGDPNGVVDGNPGDTYQDQNGRFWLNIVAPSTWVELGAGSSTSNVLTFRPGSGLTGPNVFGSWSDLYTQLDTLRTANTFGSFVIVFDDSEGSCVIPAGAWNMATVEQWISFKGANFVGPSVAVFAADGAVITHLQKIYGLGIEQAGSAPAIIINNSETFTLDNSSLASPDAGPVVRVLGAINTAIVLENQSAINFAGESSGVVTIDAGLSTRLRINGANISVGGTTIVGGAGSQLNVEIASSSFRIDGATITGVPTVMYTTHCSSIRWQGNPNGVVTAEGGTLGFQLIDEATGTLWTSTGGTAWT